MVCEITNFLCVDKIYYGREQSTTIKHGSDCSYEYYSQVIFDLNERSVSHLSANQGHINEDPHEILTITDGAHATILATYANRINTTTASIIYSRDGKSVISYIAQNLSYDGYASTALGKCETQLELFQWQ